MDTRASGSSLRAERSTRSSSHRDPELLVDGDGGGRLPAARATASIRQLVYDYVSSPYTPYLTDEFTFTREWMRDTIGVIFDVRGPHAAVIEQLNMPPSFVILDRVVWGVSAILGKLEASGAVAGDAARVPRRRPAGHRPRRRRSRLVRVPPGPLTHNPRLRQDFRGTHLRNLDANED